MEQDFQLSVPVFDTLNQEAEAMDDSVEDTNHGEEDINIPLQLEITEPNVTTEHTNSLVEKTASPHIKRIIATSYDESRFRKDLFSGSKSRIE